MTRKSLSDLKYPQRSHPRFSVDEAKERIRERQRQNRARRRVEKESKEERVVPLEDRPAQSCPDISEEEGLKTCSNSNEHKISISSGLYRAINIRFPSDTDQDPHVLHRRHLDAIRAKEYRKRQKERSIDTTTCVLGSLGGEQPYADQSNKAISSLSASLSTIHDTTIETSLGDDIDYSPGDVPTCLGEEAHTGEICRSDIEKFGVDSADNEEYETDSQIPEWYAEDQPNLIEDDSYTDLEYATEKLAQQFLGGIHGYSADQHRESLTAHIRAKGDFNHYKLNQLFHQAVPHTLDKPQLLPQQVHQEKSPLSPAQWQELFSGAQRIPPKTSFDVDSILGFVDSPAVAVHGIRFYSAPQYYQNIHNDVHLTIKRVTDNNHRPRLLTSRLKDVPHFLFARVKGADFLTLHLFFPHLLCHQDFTRLTNKQFTQWFDQIFYPALHRVCTTDHLQHLPASYRHALATCRASRIENRLHETPGHQPQLQMSYFLPPQCLTQLWQYVLATVEQPGLQDFRDPQLLVEAKGIKLRFKSADTPSDMLAVIESFDRELHRVLNFSHVLHERLYADVGKETCPQGGIPQGDKGGDSSQEAQTYIWRRCCLRNHLYQLYDGNVLKSNQNFYHKAMLRDAGSLTTRTPARFRLRRGGVLYSQMYNLTKEIIDATRTFHFRIRNCDN
ncbi:uncharacterized protein N7446_010480 [Penicillium canescens]|uniref:Uncharacterized protein n=1 Tax=Penicillium canescens TaxID=5083 RepID=A0AAD6N8A5_PENCN|nr:uncharacterized protein N7446_010480 [Penicillium canescens]KAJ6041642.1 hypothetical protein N7460_007032 [Penicillium canescens]KAJ6050371.1 hypothetical protein N7446_010480 [Penicillium canescens]KAJ6064675.1 hypothetical protein N7444_000328 [Penicillium canescens]